MHKKLRMPSIQAALIALWLFPALCLARPPGVDECRQAGDFIRKAALARDGGITEADFISRVRDDIEIMQSFPPDMRWFVQDEEDAEFLLAAATEVFRNPRLADEHQRDFVKACLVKARNKPKYAL